MPQKHSGFTLLEVIIYLALFSVIVTSGVAMMYQLLRSFEWSVDALMTESAGDFVVEKIISAITGTATISIIDAATFRVVRADIGGDSPIQFTVSNGVWYVSRGAHTRVPISATLNRRGKKLEP